MLYIISLQGTRYEFDQRMAGTLCRNVRHARLMKSEAETFQSMERLKETERRIRMGTYLIEGLDK